MRRARATTPLAAAALLLLTACGASPQGPVGEPARVDGAAATEQATPIMSAPAVEVDGDLVTVTTVDAAWRLELLDVGPVPDGELATFDGAPTPTPIAIDQQVAWVCVRATQLAGEPGAWISDDLRIEVWATPDGPRYDDLTGFAFEPADASVDVYEASGNPIGTPYERVCPIFVVPADVELGTIAIVPNGGEPAVLER